MSSDNIFEYFAKKAARELAASQAKISVEKILRNINEKMNQQNQYEPESFNNDEFIKLVRTNFEIHSDGANKKYLSNRGKTTAELWGHEILDYSDVRISEQWYAYYEGALFVYRNNASANKQSSMSSEDLIKMLTDLLIIKR